MSNTEPSKASRQQLMCRLIADWLMFSYTYFSITMNNYYTERSADDWNNQINYFRLPLLKYDCW
jgi:hypothetical protein